MATFMKAFTEKLRDGGNEFFAGTLESMAERVRSRAHDAQDIDTRGELFGDAVRLREAAQLVRKHRHLGER